MFGFLGAAALIGAAIWTMNLYEAYAGVREMTSIYGKLVSSNSQIQGELMKHTLGAAALWIFGIGLVIYHFAPDAPEVKPTVAPSVAESTPAPVVAAAAHSDSRECPHCAEIIKAAAKLCRYCHSAVEPVSKSPVVSPAAESPAVESLAIPVLTAKADAKTPKPEDFTWSVGGTTVTKPINNPSASRGSFRRF